MRLRFRVLVSELERYAKAQRDNALVHVQGRNWYVVGVTADTMSGAAWAPAMSTYRPQYWVELREA